MKKVTIIILCFIPFLTFAQNGFIPNLFCDTITGETIRVLESDLLPDCCYVWNGTDWDKRPEINGETCYNLGECSKKTGVSEVQICINGEKGIRRICKDDAGNISKEFENQNGKEIEEPKEYFIGSCEDIECTEESQTLCADGDYKGINDGDAILLSVKTCEGSDPVITGATLVTNPTLPIILPSDIVFKICDTPIETELIGCVVDEDGVRWNEILINGLSTAYQNQSTNEFGVPNGKTEQCVDPLNF